MECAFVDHKTGKIYHYFRCRGRPRIPLPGIVGSAEFMAAYQQALAAAPLAIGASKRSKPGSISSAIAEYYGSQAFRSLSGGTPMKWRAILSDSASTTVTCRSRRCRRNLSLRCSTPCRYMRH
jgi:hypothetical protein